MASIRKRGNSWQVRVSWLDDDNKRRYKNKTFKLKSEAEKFANENEYLKDRGFASVDSKTPFPDYFWTWFTTYKEDNVTERTKLTYKQVYHALQNYFPHTPIEELDRRKYRQFIAKFGKKHAKSTVSKFNSLIHACVKDALYDNDINKDFVEGTDLVYDKKRTRAVDYLSIQDMETLCDYLIGSLNQHFTAKYMILTALYTGARLGEIQALTWKDINFNFKTITINKAWHETDHQFKDTKNESSKRMIRVNQDLLDILKELKQNKTKMIFENQYQTIPTSSAVNKTLRECLQSCSINRQGFHFHSLRHTHVAYLLANHVELYIIAKRLGHSDITTTSRVYSYLIDEYKVQSDNQIENILDQINEKEAANKNSKSIQN